MKNNIEQKKRTRKSKDGKRISPTVSYLSLRILDESGIKYSDAVEEYAFLVATDNSQLLVKKEIKEFEIDSLLRDIEDIEAEAENRVKRKREQLDKAYDELKGIELSLENYLSIESNNMSIALGEVMQLVKKARENAKGKKWGIKKVPIEKIDAIAKSNNVKLISLLSRVDKNVKKEWIEI